MMHLASAATYRHLLKFNDPSNFTERQHVRNKLGRQSDVQAYRDAGRETWCGTYRRFKAIICGLQG